MLYSLMKPNVHMADLNNNVDFKLVRMIHFWNNLIGYTQSQNISEAFGLKKEATRMVGYQPLFIH